MKNIILKVLENNKFNYQTVLEEKNRVVHSFSIGLENGKTETFIEIQNDSQYVIILTICPITVPKHQLFRISEFITRINRGVYIGNFEINIEDGNIRYKTSYIFNNVHVGSEDIFIQNLYASLRMMNRYLPGFMSVIYANISPIEAIKKIENILDPTLN